MSFAALGLAPSVVAAAERRGYHEPTALQRAAIPALRRGGNTVLLGSTGAGVTGAYGLALLDRLAEEESVDGVRVLVLVPTEGSAARVAAALAGFAGAVGQRVAALAPDWPEPRDAAVIVGTAGAVAEAMRASRIKLEALLALVIDGAGGVLQLAPAGALETIVASAPRDAQRILTTADAGAALDDFLERHVRRAHWIPQRPAEEEAERRTTGTFDYIVLGENRKTAALARILAQRGPQSAVVYARTEERALELRGELELRGLTGEGAARVVAGEDGAAAADGGFAVSFDVPFDADALRARHAQGGIVFVEPAELPHLRRIAADAALAPRAQDAPAVRSADGEIAAHRELLRRALREQDIAAQLLVIEPLLEDFSGAEVAAAASALLRERAPAPAHAAQPAAEHAPRTWARLFVSIGKKDEVRPADLVGAITGETGIEGDRVGKVDIRDSFTIVEVTADAADRVIRALNGTSLRGRSVRVDYDRQPARPSKARAPREPRKTPRPRGVR